MVAPAVGLHEAFVRALAHAVMEPLSQLVIVWWGPAAIHLEPFLGVLDGLFGVGRHIVRMAPATRGRATYRRPGGPLRTPVTGGLSALAARVRLDGGSPRGMTVTSRCARAVLGRSPAAHDGRTPIPLRSDRAYDASTWRLLRGSTWAPTTSSQWPSFGEPLEAERYERSALTSSLATCCSALSTAKHDVSRWHGGYEPPLATER